MAVPKKKTSKSKTSSRKSKWKIQISKQIDLAKTIAGSYLSKKSTSFIYLEKS